MCRRTLPPQRGSLDFARSVVQKATGSLRHLTAGYRWVGVIANVQYRSTIGPLPAAKLCEPLFDKMVNVPRAGRDLSVFQVQYGFREDRYFRTYTVAGFETCSLRIALPAGSRARRIDTEGGQLRSRHKLQSDTLPLELEQQ